MSERIRAELELTVRTWLILTASVVSATVVYVGMGQVGDDDYAMVGAMGLGFVVMAALRLKYYHPTGGDGEGAG